MKLALLFLEITDDVMANYTLIKNAYLRAIQEDVDLVITPNYALTGAGIDPFFHSTYNQSLIRMVLNDLHQMVTVPIVLGVMEATPTLYHISRQGIKIVDRTIPDTELTVARDRPQHSVRGVTMPTFDSEVVLVNDRWRYTVHHSGWYRGEIWRKLFQTMTAENCIRCVETVTSSPHDYKISMESFDVSWVPESLQNLAMALHKFLRNHEKFIITDMNGIMSVLLYDVAVKTVGRENVRVAGTSAFRLEGMGWLEESDPLAIRQTAYQTGATLLSGLTADMWASRAGRNYPTPVNGDLYPLMDYRMSFTDERVMTAYLSDNNLLTPTVMAAMAAGTSCSRIEIASLYAAILSLITPSYLCRQENTEMFKQAIVELKSLHGCTGIMEWIGVIPALARTPLEHFDTILNSA